MKPNHKKKIISWGRLLPLTIALGLVACGGDGSGPTASNGSGGNSAATAEKGPATAEIRLNSSWAA